MPFQKIHTLLLVLLASVYTACVVPVQLGPPQSPPNTKPDERSNPPTPQPFPIQRFTQTVALPNVSIRGLSVVEREQGGYWIAANQGSQELYKAGTLTLLQLDTKGSIQQQKSIQLDVFNYASLRTNKQGLMGCSSQHIFATDTQGNLQWKQSVVPSPKSQILRCIWTSKGQIILSGWKEKSIDTRAMWIASFDIQSQRLLWSKEWTLDKRTEGYGLYLHASTQIIVAGRVRNPSQSRPLLMAISLQGQELWKKIFSTSKGSGYQTAFDVAPLGPKQWLLATNQFGYFGRGHTGAGKTRLVYLKQNNTIEQQKEFSGGGVFAPVSLHVDAQFQPTLLYHELQYAGPEGVGHIVLSAWDNKRKKKWQRTIQWGRNVRGYSLIQTRDGGFAWTGWGTQKGSNRKQLLFFKSGPKGLLQ